MEEGTVQKKVTEDIGYKCGSQMLQNFNLGIEEVPTLQCNQEGVDGYLLLRATLAVIKGYETVVVYSVTLTSFTDYNGQNDSDGITKVILITFGSLN